MGFCLTAAAFGKDGIFALSPLFRKDGIFAFSSIFCKDGIFAFSVTGVVVSLLLAAALVTGVLAEMDFTAAVLLDSAGVVLSSGAAVSSAGAVVRQILLVLVQRFRR